MDNSYSQVYRAWALASRGRIYQRLGCYEEALADFDQAIKLSPDDAWAFVSRGETYRLMGCYEEALADFDRAIELQPGYIWAIASRGETYRRLRRYEEALADFDRVIELQPNHTWAIARRGETYRLMGRYVEALADFDQTIKLQPDWYWYRYNRALTYKVLGQTDRAQTDFAAALQYAQEAYEEEPEDWRNTLNLACCHLIVGEAKRAECLYRQVLAGSASPYYIHEAIRDLEDLLVLFPEHPLACAMRDLLQGHLQSHKGGGKT